ncbi:MAG TPA: WD40 repeat domain-containing protein, partial [Polyangiaceae bacterium]|nr:WD40 repeat domain-containing protein [Polyangiaceae bacterium]
PPPPTTDLPPALSCAEEPLWIADSSDWPARRGYLGFSPDGSRLAWSSGYYTAVLREFDSRSGGELARVEASDGPTPHNELVDRDAAWTRDLVGIDELRVAETGALESVLLETDYQAQASSSCAFFDENGSRVFRPTCDASGPSWQVLRATDGQLETSFGLPGECVGMTASQRGGDVLLTLDDSIAYWPASAPQPTAQARHEHDTGERMQRGLVGVAIAPVGDRAISIAADGSVQLYRLPELSPEASALTAHVTYGNANAYAPLFLVSPVSYSRDGSLLALAGSDGAIELRRSDNLDVVSRLPDTDAIAVAFAPDDSLLAVATERGLAVYDCR